MSCVQGESGSFRPGAWSGPVCEAIRFGGRKKRRSGKGVRLCSARQYTVLGPFISDPENTFVCHCAIQQAGEAGTRPQGQSLSVADLPSKTSQAVSSFH